MCPPWTARAGRKAACSNRFRGPVSDRPGPRPAFWHAGPGTTRVRQASPMSSRIPPSPKQPHPRFGRARFAGPNTRARAGRSRFGTLQKKAPRPAEGAGLPASSSPAETPRAAPPGPKMNRPGAEVPGAVAINSLAARPSLGAARRWGQEGVLAAPAARLVSCTLSCPPLLPADRPINPCAPAGCRSATNSAEPRRGPGGRNPAWGSRLRCLP